ncbi:hypothetical protein [Brasilonema sennae]|uniref:hypothetical protein n=1 Tax=Brasilonema sennae TaxID=1397703 RepID=UPI001556E503|nr:hypothetical protein [Brasilonema sennae]
MAQSATLRYQYWLPYTPTTPGATLRKAASGVYKSGNLACALAPLTPLHPHPLRH